MLTHADLRKGTRIILEGEPYEVLEATPLKKAQRRVIIQCRVRNLLNGNAFERNFHQGDTFEETEITKFDAKFIYAHRDTFFFAKADGPSRRFDLSKTQIGGALQFLRPNQEVEAIEFKGQVVNISLPIKIQLRITEAPPGVKGERSQPGTKIVTLETGVKVNVPLFVEEGDTIEINTETQEYVRRIE